MARSQLASRIERESLRWIAERVPWSTWDGTFTSGGNEANFSGLAIALAAHFPNAMQDGIASIGAQPVFYSSSEAHHSLDKSAGLLGLGRSALRRIAVNDRVQLDIAKLEAAISQDRTAGRRPFCIVATAGTTNSGAIDDIVALADVCHGHNLWLHVDGAYGAGAIFSNAHRDLVRGIERADSITIDPHKWLAMPFSAGVILTRHPGTLRSAFEVSTPYMPRFVGADPNVLDNFKISSQWSRRMNSLKFWLTLRVHGRAAYEELVDRQLCLARHFAEWVRSCEHFELAAPVGLPIVNVRVRGENESEVAAANQRVVDEVTRDGRQWISVTNVAGRSVIRVMVISYLTSERNLQQLQSALTTAAERITQKTLASSG
jgi:glutamate/tyrosine decarboxylase-like PLP-dependent enzyme